MDSGGVEFSGGAVDFHPDESPKEKSGGPVETVPVEKVATEDIRFRATDIDNTEEVNFFDKPEDTKRKEKAEKRRMKAEAKRILRESKQKNVGGASKDIVESEERLKKEQSRIESERRQAKIKGFLGRRAKHWYIYVSAAAIIAITICAIIFVPQIIQGINDANDAKYVDDNKSLVLRLFEEVVGKRFGKEQLEELVAKYDGKLEIDYYDAGGQIHPDNYWLESVNMYLGGEDGATYSGFFYVNEASLDGVSIIEREGSYYYFRRGEELTFKTVDDAISAYVLDLRSSGE
ncbi:hypothetical protein J6X13_01350 [Candidatus Saccharibacteria bacterium]|nr:hypothetical protein [Candidatus Saccharibacteria bacterium]